MTARCLVLTPVCAALVAVAALALLATPTALAQPDAAVTDRWQQQLVEAEQQLLAGEWRHARRSAARLLPQMILRIEATGDGPSWLATALYVEAAAAAGQGYEEEARWAWWGAQNLDPELRTQALPDLGAVGDFLDAHRLRAADQVPTAAGVVLDGRGSTAFLPAMPQAIAQPDKPYAMWRGRVVVQLLVGADGRPSQPRVLDDGGERPGTVWLQISALRDWRFQPATLDGAAVGDVVVVDGLQTNRWLPSPGWTERARGELGLDRLDRLVHRALTRLAWDPDEALCLWRSAELPEEERGHAVYAELVRLEREAEAAAAARPAPEESDSQASLPEKLHAPAAGFTDAARQAGVRGVVIVQAVIGADGRVDRAKVLKGLPLGLDEASIAAVCSWRMKPGTVDGQPVDLFYNLTFNFSL
ncbi:MAG TPA: energy transducer TonB [Thermoanaerobaculia bacterium]|nr:energy transducer TonB [Thermoanaerobaculia bacterium]